LKRRAFLGAAAAAAFPAWAAGARYEQGLLWKVTGKDGAASHLFGTFQAPEEKLGSLPREVLRAFDAADRLVVETRPDAYSTPRFREAATFSGGRTLAGAIGASDFERVAGVLAEMGVPKEAANQLKPWAILLNLGATGGAQASPPDARLAALAEAHGVPIEPLEGLEEQIFTFDECPMESQVALLRHSLAHPDEIPKRADVMLAAYLRGDLAAIARIEEEQDVRFPEIAPHHAVLTKRLLHDRSVVMAHRMQRGLRMGGSFIAIGALHLHGEKGVPALLEKAGYTMSRVY
jgi:uncharacterized protein YbaP (TraB family)